jgi:hypothetical protein
MKIVILTKYYSGDQIRMKRERGGGFVAYMGEEGFWWKNVRKKNTTCNA